jgi:hypothetical protein
MLKEGAITKVETEYFNNGFQRIIPRDPCLDFLVRGRKLHESY